MATIGRNDPCWCGSGKKYKHCHLKMEQAQQGELVQQERAYQTLYAKLVDLAREIRGDADFQAAYDLYWNNRTDVASPDQLGPDRISEFLEYYVFDFRTSDEGKTILDLVAERRRSQLSPAEQRLLGPWRKTYRSLYQIMSRDRDSVTLRDLLLGGDITTNDQLPPEVQPGLVLASRVLPVGERKHMGRGLTAVPPELVDPMVVYVQRQFQRYQERRSGGAWPDFLREASYLFAYFMLDQIAPRTVATPAADKEAETTREVLRELQSGIIVGPLDQHYARWAEKPVAAWDNRTPRQLMATERGRERVTAVLDALAESEETKRAAGQPAYDVNRLRALLGFEQSMPIGGGRLVG